MKHLQLFENFKSRVPFSADLENAIRFSSQNPSRSKPILVTTTPGSDVSSEIKKMIHETVPRSEVFFIDCLTVEMSDFILPKISGGFTPSSILPQDDRESVVLVFNEVNRANRQVLDFIMRLATQRESQGYKLPSECVVILISEGTEEGRNLGAGLENRFRVIYEAFNNSERFQGMSSQSGSNFLPEDVSMTGDTVFCCNLEDGWIVTLLDMKNSAKMKQYLEENQKRLTVEYSKKSGIAFVTTGIPYDLSVEFEGASFDPSLVDYFVNSKGVEENLANEFTNSCAFTLKRNYVTGSMWNGYHYCIPIPEYFEKY